MLKSALEHMTVIMSGETNLRDSLLVKSVNNPKKLLLDLDNTKRKMGLLKRVVEQLLFLLLAAK